MVQRQALLEANTICEKLREATEETFYLSTRYGKIKENNTITIFAGSNPDYPFPIVKALDVQDEIGGMKIRKTSRDYTALEKTINSGETKINIVLYTGACLNPDAHEGMILERGTIGRVMNPEDCNGLEGIFKKVFEDEE